MRHLITILTYLFFCTTILANNTSQRTDSLLSLLKNTHSSERKIQIYRDLADIHIEMPQEKEYLLKIYEEAKKTKNKAILLDVLNDIIINETKAYKKDSIIKYIDDIKKIATPNESKPLLSFFNMRFFDTLCYLNKSEEAINDELSFLDSKPKDENDPYKTVALNYTTGMSFYANKKFYKSIPYLERAMELSKTFPNKEKVIYQRFIGWSLCYAYAQSGKGKKAVYIMENIIHQLELDYKINYQKQRPFYKIDLFRLQYYSFMIVSLPYLTIEQEKFYWNRILEIGKHLTNPLDKYNYYHCVSNYYSNNHTKIDLPKALSANDSLIKIAETLAPRNLPGLYKSKSIIHEESKDYTKALFFLKISHHIQDSLSSKDALKQLNELQVKYDINSLNSEKNKLEIKNKKNILISLSILLSIVGVICIYLYFSLKKEKKMKLELKYLHVKVQESEKMKQSFINSICHEIRTPLNAIVGFSDLITNEEIDVEMRREFPAEIQKNTVLLTSLVNSMLEVANLDVSEEKLPCEPTDLRGICIQGMEMINPKVGIEYKLNISEESMFISTNAQYLFQVIEHLLNNANKFTEQGCITLDYNVNETETKIYIRVTDTGCGIPIEKHEEVFNRFSKLDTFIPGNGLGLYLCRLIVKRLTGEIKIDPDYTKGTRMIVILPLQ